MTLTTKKVRLQAKLIQLNVLLKEILLLKAELGEPKPDITSPDPLERVLAEALHAYTTKP